LLILSATRCRNAKINNRSGKIRVYAKLVAVTKNYKHSNHEVMKIKN
jgi:hypothetical protein